jgi:hypothetical protein
LRISRVSPSRLILVALLAGIAGDALAQAIPRDDAPIVAQVRKPALGIRKAQLLGAAAGLALGAALGRGHQDTVPTLRPLRRVDGVLTASAAAFYLSGELIARRRSEPDPARVATGTTPGDVNGFDRKMRRLAVGHRSLEKRLLLDHLSSTTLMVSLFQPVGMTITSDAPHKWSRDVPVIAEATAITISVNAFVKHLTRRSRPAAHFCESEHAVFPCPPDTRLSFFSGHTSSAFAAAVAAGTIADFHHLEQRRWIWASGLTFATATAVLRVMADQHYATDVLTGMAAGGLAGWLIPKLHKPDRTAPALARASPTVPVAVAGVPVVLRGGRSAALVTVGSVGGGPYVGIRLAW